MNKTSEDLEKFYKELHEWYHNFYARLIPLLEDIDKNKLVPEELADVGFFCRKIEELSKEIKIEAEAKKDKIGDFLSQKQYKKLLQGDLDDPSIRGEYAIAIPKVSKSVGIPKAGSPEFSELCDFLDIPDEARNAVSFSYKRLGEWVSEKAAEGKEVPNFAKVYVKYSCTFRKMEGK